MISDSRAIAHLLDLLKVEGLSGDESRVAALVKKKLRDAGVRSSWMSHDKAHEKIGDGFQIGNLIVQLPGTKKAPRVLYASHLDTVPLCRGARPVRRGKRIVSATDTALGGDNRTAVACLVTLAESLLKKKLPHPPLTLLFTVGEEIGLRGARHVSVADLGRPKMGFNIDSGAPGKLVIGATGADRWEADIIGISSHAGVHPEDGVSAALIASKAIADVSKRGYFGKVSKGRKQGTSNVGVLEGGEVTNQVLDLLRLRGECRSHDSDFLDEITGAYRDAFQRAAKSVKNAAGKSGKVKFRARKDYHAFAMDEDSAPVRLALEAARRLRLTTGTSIANGGLDANWLNRKGVPTVTFGAGQHNAHTVREYADIDEYLGGCRLGVEIATSV